MHLFVPPVLIVTLVVQALRQDRVEMSWLAVVMAIIITFVWAGFIALPRSDDRAERRALEMGAELRATVTGLREFPLLDRFYATRLTLDVSYSIGGQTLPDHFVIPYPWGEELRGQTIHLLVDPEDPSRIVYPPLTAWDVAGV